jgi:hypothetical protein
VNDIFEQPDNAATPFREEERRALELAQITSQEQLNAAEQENIARGQEWALSRRRYLLSESRCAPNDRKIGQVYVDNPYRRVYSKDYRINISANMPSRRLSEDRPKDRPCGLAKC